MLSKHFTKGKKYFHLRNNKNETVFHVAAKHNAKESIQMLNGRTVFLEELLKKDFKGDTPIHVAAKTGNWEITEYFLMGCTKAFIEMQNDFGLTVIESVR